jgi:inosine-uridine nucleoside N-ribohydrolase
MSQKPIPLVLDTDVGDDIDDALALALILRSPALELRGVTTVFRNAPRRALLTREVLRDFNRSDVPLASGISKPLLEPFDPRLGAQMQVLESDTWETPPPHGVDFLVALAQHDEPEPLVIAPIGPLTNIAAAIVREPDLIHKTRLVVMGGWLQDPQYPEWNIRCDPEAAAIVFESGIAIDMIGLDVTLKCKLSPEQVARVGGVHPFLGRLMKAWTDETRGLITLHDPLAILTMMSDVVQFEPRCVRVGLCAKERGHTIESDGEPNCRVAISVEAERAVNEFLDRLTAPPTAK